MRLDQKVFLIFARGSVTQGKSTYDKIVETPTNSYLDNFSHCLLAKQGETRTIRDLGYACSRDFWLACCVPWVTLKNTNAFWGAPRALFKYLVFSAIDWDILGFALVFLYLKYFTPCFFFYPDDVCWRHRLHLQNENSLERLITLRKTMCNLKLEREMKTALIHTNVSKFGNFEK